MSHLPDDTSSSAYDPYNADRPLMMRCACGQDHAPNQHIQVARSVEEAELQASGKSIQELAAEAEAAADFEIAELFDEMGAANDFDPRDER
jgi:hypothetical protein